MAGTAIEFEATGFDQVIGSIEGLTAMELTDLAFNIGAILESSTKRRIADEKTAPDGTPWVPWSESYDETRNHSVHSLLVGEGDLRDSIQNYSTGTTTRVGTNMIYGAIHQFGGEEVDIAIPARPYLGLSAEDEAEIRELVTGEIEEALQ